MSWFSRAITLPADKNQITDVFDVQGFATHVAGSALLSGVAIYSQTHDWKAILVTVLSAVAATAKAFLKIPQVVIKP